MLGCYQWPHCDLPTLARAHQAYCAVKISTHAPEAESLQPVDSRIGQFGRHEDEASKDIAV